MKECVIVPSYNRTELLFCCLRRLRGYDGDIPIHVFPDRGTWQDPQVFGAGKLFEAKIHQVPNKIMLGCDSYGNTENVMNAYLWAFNEGYERVFYVESDVMVHKDFFSWHREQQEEFPNIFASMAWIFNREAPIVDDLMFQPWIYSIGLCFSRKKLALIAEHATPKYYDDMAGYIQRRFKNSHLNSPFGIMHYEQDGLLQRILEEDKSQTVSSGVAKCSHVGFVRSYGTGTEEDYRKFLGFDGLPFDERVKRVEAFIADPYARMDVFGRALVEREVGHVIAKRRFTYKITMPGGWESTYTSELERKFLPKRINSVPVSEGTIIQLCPNH